MVKVSGYDYSSYGGVEYQRFKSDYFTGADIRIYFGDIWVDEVTSLQFTLQEQVAPIFGYASYTWDRVARGNRYIQGSFTINFKESYYLQSVMNSLTSKMKGSSTTSTGFSSSQWKKGLNIEHLMSKSGDSFNSIADEFEKSLWGEGRLQTQVDSKNGTTYFYPNATGE
ncbi:hypothetical protein QO179_24735 [Bacillus stercoris]|nr:hypothetical protein [Bacillus stercoris]